MTREDYKVDNSGSNQGIIVGHNEGDIYCTLQHVVKIPSLISTVVKTLGTLCLEDPLSLSGQSLEGFKPDEKIEYNHVLRYRDIIKEFAAYYWTCDNHLNVYDDSHIRGKAKILNCVHLWYLEAKGNVLAQNENSGKADIEIVREHSDELIDIVKKSIVDVVKNSLEFESMHIEDLEIGVACFTCYCFMECRVLEKPV